MIVRRGLTPTAVFVALTLLGGLDGSAAERWSRQVSNSEWIPLANPRAAASVQLPQDNARAGLLTSATHLPNPIQSLALPPALQHQYQEQLLQLQKTQESIQKLLLLQQQLRAQQQLLQSQAYVPNYTSAEDEKQALPPSAVQAPETLIPSHPSADALPPVYPPQNFLSQRPGLVHQELNGNQGQVVFPQSGESAEGPSHAYVPKQGSHQRPDGKRLKGHQAGLPQSSLIESAGGEDEEIQLVYVPAETLAQRGHLKRNRGRKPYPVRQQQHPQRENEGSIDETPLSPEQAAFARQVLQEIQKEHEEKHFLKEERVKDFAKLNEEQKALERKTRLQQEALQREQELLRQKEIEKKHKELERQEEVTRQRELDRIRDTREKQRQEELERRRLAEIRAKEEKRREEEARQQLELENQPRDQLRTTNPGGPQNGPQSQALIREQSHRQHLADSTRSKKLRNRARQRVNQESQSSYHREPATTTPSPNQPPLSVYMGGSGSRLESVRVTDVLRLLRDAKTIAVLDNVGPESPRVFVGPSNLDPPYGYAKFDLPYLSSIDHNRVERKVDKLPFFVAPLSFDPPPGYSKIPFPAPHIGSVVVNTLAEGSSSSENTPTVDEQSPNPMPLIEPNSYSDADQSGSISTTASYDSSNASPNFPADSDGPKYESSHSTSPAGGSRFRFRQTYYDGKPASVGATYYDREQSAARQESKSTTPQSPKFDTTVSYRQEISYSSTPNFQDRGAHDPSTKEQDLAAQLALINQELDQQRETHQRYSTAEQYHGQSNLEPYDANDVRAPVGSAQYNLPAELPPISPHLPGLINSLLDKQEGNLPPVASTPPPTTTTTPSTTTTTARASSTTYRPRTRSRVVSTRTRTTQAPANKTERATRRPTTHSRSKSRFSTTTEEYNESPYEPTKARAAEATQRTPNTIEDRRPTTRAQKLKTRDRATSQSAVQNHNSQSHPSADFENYPAQSDSQGNASPVYSANGPASNLQQKETPSQGVSDYTRENYSPVTPTQTENYPPLREFTIQHGIPSISDDYSKSSQNYPQTSQPQEANHRPGATYDQNHGGFEQAALEMTPVNGFNYQVVSVSAPDQRPKEYPRYQTTKLDDASYNFASTEDPRIRGPAEEHRYSPIYEVNMAQTQPDYSVGGQNSFRNDGKLETDPNASPIFVPLQQSKHEEYELHIPSTEGPVVEITTKGTTTPANLIIRQRVRGRLSGGGSRPHQDSAIQTRPRGSQDEYVRFSVVSHDSSRAGQRSRDGTRPRPRARPQSTHGSQVQTEGNEYIRVHAAQQQRLIATTTPSTTTSTTTDRTSEEDVDYGFIRPPSFQPVNSPQPVHPVDSRFQTPVTYRPALSEIQHIIPNDETAVESSPAHILKNRPKYQQTATRRPTTTKIFAPTPTAGTATETIPVATTMPDNSVYTTRSKSRPDETKTTTRPRGRIRRPTTAKKRTTSTTESGLEANNELPLDENYPRITPQQLSVTVAGQQPLYDDNFDVTPQFEALNRNRPAQFYEESGENYPPEFLLNFGNLPEHSRREEYDQAQLAGVQSKKYGNSGHVSSDTASTIGDIYGAESQWSTKLSKTSFQPSFASNRATDETKKSRVNRLRNDQTNENAPEIITAGPEVPSVTMIVSADYQKRLNNNADAGEMMDVFGKKTNAPDHTEKLNDAVTSSPTETRNWIREENFTAQTDNISKVKVTVDPTGRKTRRKRIRVRVRPLPGDFVTAESQHHNSAANNLHQDEYKHDHHESKVTTEAQPITTTVATTAETTTKKSILQDFLEEMLKRDEISAPTRVNFVTTDWPTTTPYVASETTTLKENLTTLTSNAESSTESSRNESQKAAPKEAVASIQEEAEARKQTRSEEFWDKDAQEDQSEQNNLEDIEMYSLPSSYPDGSGTSTEIEDAIAEMTGLPAATEEIRKLSAIDKEDREHIMTLKRQRVKASENEAHPKNHRAKWSEVKYPPSDRSASSSRSTTSIPGVVTRDEGDGSVKTLSDYVKAIFDSMKSAEGDGVEIAKVVEAKKDSQFDNVASVHEVNAGEKSDRGAGTTDASATQRVAQEGATEAQRSETTTTTTTTKEDAVTFETTTPVPDDTTAADTITPSEVMTVEPFTTTSIKQSAAGDAAVQKNSTTVLGKVLRTSTTTRVSHMTEICYRGRCVMTQPKMENDSKR